MKYVKTNHAVEVIPQLKIKKKKVFIQHDRSEVGVSLRSKIVALSLLM